MSTDSYIVRVYRREKEGARTLVGTVECVETQEKKPFNSFEELKTILKSSGPDSHRNPPEVIKK